jgi:hypothetical protein
MTKVDLNISSRQEIVSIIGQLRAGYPDPANPPPPGRRDRLVVSALRRIYWLIPPGPNPQWRWQSIVSPQPQPWVEVELNPQPLPPRTLFLPPLRRNSSTAPNRFKKRPMRWRAGKNSRASLLSVAMSCLEVRRRFLRQRVPHQMAISWSSSLVVFGRGQRIGSRCSWRANRARGLRNFWWPASPSFYRCGIQASDDRPIPAAVSVSHGDQKSDSRRCAIGGAYGLAAHKLTNLSCL